MTKHFNNDFVKVFILNVFYESPFEKKNLSETADLKAVHFKGTDSGFCTIYARVFFKN